MVVDPQTLTIPIVIAAGIVDGFNPCAFAVLLLFVSFTLALLQMQTNYRYGLVKVGLIYISGIFITYVLIGAGFLSAVSFFSTTHLVGKAAAYISMIIGVIFMKDYFVPGGFSLAVPSSLHTAINRWIKHTSTPGVFGAGVLVGLCTVPCSGGIYLAILGLLAIQSSQLQGMAYLLLYNFMFVMPLLILLFASSNRAVVEKMVAWQSSNKAKVKLLMGSFMVAIGFVILWIA